MIRDKKEEETFHFPEINLYFGKLSRNHIETSFNIGDLSPM
jgi:hypothetical protein